VNKWRNITIIISIIVGIAVFWSFYNNAPLIEDFRNDPVVQEDYDYLKECISKVAQTLNTEVIDDPNVKVYPLEFGKGTLCITARLMRDNYIKCTVKAYYALVLENEVKVDYDNVSYRLENNTQDSLEGGQLSSVVLAALCGAIVYFLLYYVPKRVLKK